MIGIRLQVCSAVKRIYVHEAIYDDFVTAASEEVGKLSSLVGDGRESNVKYDHGDRINGRSKMSITCQVRPIEQ